MIKLAIFDLDGTLLDTIGDLAVSCDYALGVCGYPRHTASAYRQMVGNGIRKLVERALPEDCRDEVVVERVRRRFVEYYEANIDAHTYPYDGIADVLRALSARGVRIAVVSNKFHSGTVKLVSRFFPDTDFVAVFGQREGVPLKPDPHSDCEIMTLAGVPASETVHIGDSAVDIATARAAGVRSVGVSWGFRPRTEIEKAGADHIADTTAELAALLSEI